MQKSEINAGEFVLTAYGRANKLGGDVNIYIEGDGFAAAARDRLSVNPTPRNPMGLMLAAKDNAPNVFYLARPCQYTSFDKNPNCENKYWSGSRFAPQVIESMNIAVDKIKELSGADKINLIGYSGGAAVSVILASRRVDIATIRTVAGNLDHAAINKYHRVDQLDNSLNPIDYAAKISDIPQYHFSGEKDNVVPVFIAEKFAKKSEQGKGCVKVSALSGATHHKGWAENWKYLLSRPVVCG